MRRPRFEVTTLWDGRTVFCRGYRDGLPVFGWHDVPSGLATRRQLRAAGLRPGGQDPVALLVFGHRKPARRVEVAHLYRLDLAHPKRTPTLAQRAAIELALEARRTCRTCHQDRGYYLPTSTRQCWTCWQTTNHDDERGEVA